MNLLSVCDAATVRCRYSVVVSFVRHFFVLHSAMSADSMALLVEILKIGPVRASRTWRTHSISIVVDVQSAIRFRATVHWMTKTHFTGKTLSIPARYATSHPSPSSTHHCNFPFSKRKPNTDCKALCIFAVHASIVGFRAWIAQQIIKLAQHRLDRDGIPQSGTPANMVICCLFSAILKRAKWLANRENGITSNENRTELLLCYFCYS